MARYCLDASVVLGWLLEENLPLVDDFWAGIDSDDELVAAELLRTQCTSNIRTAVFEGRIDAPDGRQVLRELLGIPVRVVSDSRQFSAAFDLAQRFQNRKAYDVHYLAVAQLEGLELVTIDRGLRHAAQEVGVTVRYLR